MNPKKEKSISKLLSLVLRHQPEIIGIELGPGGWTPVESLLAGLQEKGRGISWEELSFVVDNNPKKRFSFNEDRTLIRANQGHSVPVDLGLEPLAPPEILFHGTAERNLDSIRQHGLEKKNRHHVHLSPDPDTARQVGQRHGKPLVFRIRAAEMASAGHIFYRSENGVWLTNAVPPGFLDFPV